MTEYRCECECKWCANLDATPCSVIEDLVTRVEALETLRALDGGAE